MTTMTDAAQRGHRATGAMFFAVFGGMWLAGWVNRSGAPAPLYVVVAVLALALLVVAIATRRRHAAAMAAVAVTPERRRAARIFHVVNAGQWIVILVLGNVLVNTGHGAWLLPMVIAVVGLHFFPIAQVFHYWPHHVTGAALLVLGALFPLLAAQGPVDPVGFLGAGLILWCSAAWALRRG